MGFSEEAVADALLRYDNDVNRSLDFLLSTQSPIKPLAEKKPSGGGAVSGAGSGHAGVSRMGAIRGGIKAASPESREGSPGVSPQRGRVSKGRVLGSGSLPTAEDVESLFLEEVPNHPSREERR